MNPPKARLLLSLRPEHAEAIFAGTKTVEFRRVRPRVSEGDWVLVYVTSPRKALVGAFEVAEVVTDHPASLWRRFAQCGGITQERFDEYYAGATVAYGILVRRVMRLPEALPLQLLRRRLPGFHPPQIYRYLKEAEIALVGAGAFG
jgi:predicted transcriptional regulator